MSEDEQTGTPPPPPGMPPAPPGMPPAPPGMPPAPPGMPPAPPGMPPAPPGMPPAPPGMPPAPPGMPAPPAEMPPAPPGIPAPPAEMPPAPPGMPAPPVEMPPAPPGMPPAPPGMPAPPAEMPPAPPGMPPAPPAEMPPAPPEMPPAPPEMPPAPPEMPPAPPAEMPPAPPEMPPAPPEMPPAPPGMPPAPPAEMPPAPPEMPPAPPEMPPAPPEMEAPVADETDSQPENVENLPSPADALLAPSAPDPLAALTPPAADPLAALVPNPPVEVHEADMPAVDPLSPVAPVGEDFVSAGAKIRRSSEIDDVPGDKLEGSIHETEKSVLTAEGEIVKQTVNGILKVRNPSESDRIYDIDVMLNNTTNTDLAGDHVQVDELESRKEFSTKYKVKNSRMLVLKERLDTNPDRDQERSLSVSKGNEDGPIHMELEVENVSNVMLTDVVVNREIPSQLTMIATGGASIDDGSLTWEIGALAPGESKNLALTGTILIDGIKPVSAGVAKATYKAEAALSSLAFRELDAFCRGFAYINSVESERPDNWECKTIFENRSSFTVDLVKLQVRMKGSEDLLFNIADVSDDVLPDSRWESETVTVESTGKPDFTWDLGYTVLPKASHTTEGTLELQPSTFEVLDSTVSKKYSKTVLPSYRRQELNATLTIKNEGSATINLMRLTDDIPGLFDAPAVEDISVKVDGTDLVGDQFKAEVSEGISIEKEMKSPDGNGHTLTMTIGTRGPIGLAPGKSLSITYPLVAPDPTPGNEMVAGPARCEFSAERFGPVCSRDVDEVPIMKVKHNRRNFSAGKSVMPMGGKGRYEVLILFENNGDNALQDVCINDLLPLNFDLKDWSVRGAGKDKRTDVNLETTAEDNGNLNVWTIPVVEKGERLELSFEIKGDGEVDAEVLNQFHGVTFGDEIEDEIDVDVEVAEETSSDEESESDSPGEGYKWREDVLLRVMESHGIDASLRDDFVRHAIKFDDDDNFYLKKSEIEAAAAAWEENSDDQSDESVPEEEESETESDEVVEEVVEETSEETAAESEEETNEEETADTKVCPICSKSVDINASTCECGFTF